MASRPRFLCPLMLFIIGRLGVYRERTTGLQASFIAGFHESAMIVKGFGKEWVTRNECTENPWRADLEVAH